MTHVRDSSELCATWNPVDRLLDQDKDALTQGEFTTWGCDVHCAPCPVAGDIAGGGNQFTLNGVSTNGIRFMLPPPDQPSRDGRGVFHALKSLEPHLFPQDAHFDRASCYRADTGQECPGMSSCACDPQLDVDWGNGLPDDYEGPDCRDGTNGGQFRRSPVADIYFFKESTYASGTSLWMDCRREVPSEKGPLRVRTLASRGDLYQAHLMRSNHGCIPNPMATCIGAWHSFGAFPSCNPSNQGAGFHNGPTRSVWGFWRVDSLNVHLIDPPNQTDETQAIFDAKNAALAWASGSTHFDQMDKTRTDGVGNFGAQDINGNITFWSRGWAPPDGEDPPVYMVLENCRLKHSGCPVHVELVILSGRLAMSWAPILVHDDTGEEVVNRIYPSIRMRLHLILGVRASLPTECRLERPWLEDGGVALSLEGVDWPTVVPPLDEIEYRTDLGVPFTPPSEVDWWGSRQELTDAPGVWEDIWNGASPSPHVLHVECCELARRSSPTTIHGAPTMNDEPVRVQHFGGGVQISLPVEICDGVGDDGGGVRPAPPPTGFPGVAEEKGIVV